MRILRGKARRRACREAIHSSQFRALSSEHIKAVCGLVNAVDLYQLRHELRTPLTGILGMAELLSAQHLPGHAPFWVATLQACGQQMASLIDRSLRPGFQHGRIVYLAEAGIEGGGFLEQLVCSHWPAASAGGTQLYLLVQPEARECWRVDPVLLRQGLDNLLANAIRFSPEGYVLLEATVLPSPNTDILQLVVENCGPGQRQQGEGKSASALQIADGNFTPHPPGNFDYADRSYRMFSRGQGLKVVEQVCRTLRGKLTRSLTAAGATRFALELPDVILRRETLIKPFSPNLLRTLHCRLLLEDPMDRVVSALLAGMDLPFEHIDKREEAALHALPEHQLLICTPSRLPVAAMGREERCKPHAICLAAKGTPFDQCEWYVQSLPEPLLQAGLQAALLRCLALRGMAGGQVASGAYWLPE